MTDPAEWNVLSETERRVVELVADGLTNRVIGERLFVSRYTVDYHLRQIYRKLRISTRAEVATWLVATKAAGFTIFDGVMDGITVLEPMWDSAGEIADFRIVYANAACIDAYGRHVSDLVGQPLREAFPTKTPGAFYRPVFMTGEPLELHDFEREDTIDGVKSITRYDIRAFKHGSNVIVAHRTIGSDRGPAT